MPILSHRQQRVTTLDTFVEVYGSSTASDTSKDVSLNVLVSNRDPAASVRVRFYKTVDASPPSDATDFFDEGFLESYSAAIRNAPLVANPFLAPGEHLWVRAFAGGASPDVLVVREGRTN